jgi:hypothetical protein
MKAAAWCIRAWRETPRAHVGLRSRVRTFWTNHSVSNNPAAIFPHASCSDRAVTLWTTPVAVRRTVQVTVEKDKGISGIGNAIWNNIANSRIGSLVRRDTISQSSVISLIARSRHHRERDHRPNSVSADRQARFPFDAAGAPAVTCSRSTRRSIVGRIPPRSDRLLPRRRESRCCETSSRRSECFYPRLRSC